MSESPAPPDDEHRFDPARSSVRLTRNSRGQVQFEVKVIAPEDNDVDFAAKKAVAIVRSLEAEFPWK
jgi:hypothetical protein